jgi:phage/plasmid-like protein (TIGR03299 family)
MAHRIEADDTVVFVGETPWHGIGEQVDENLTPDEMMCAAHLDWRVIEYELGLKSQKIGNEGQYRSVGNGWKGLVRSTDGKLLDIVTDDYHTHQNSEIFATCKQFFDAGNMTMETAGSLEGGRVIWALAKLDASFTLPGSVDKTTMYVLFSTGHKSGFATQADLTAIRAVCANTIRAARGTNGEGGDGAKYGRFRLIHSAKFTQAHVNQAVRVMQAGVAALEIYRQKAERLASARWDNEITRAFCCELLAPQFFTEALKRTEFPLKSLTEAPKQGFSLDQVLQRSAHYLNSDILTDQRGETVAKVTRSAKKVMELVNAQPGADMFPNSAWNAFNAVTYYVDHDRGRTRDSGLNSAWYGEGAKVKQDALDLALAYTEALYN